MLGPGHGWTADALYNVAYYCEAQGRSAEALTLLERALPVARREMGVDAPEVVDMYALAAAANNALGKRERALEYWRQARESVGRLAEDDYERHHWALDNYAQTLYMLERSEEALAAFRAAVDYESTAPGAVVTDLIWSVDMLARLHSEMGANKEAEAGFLRAMKLAADSRGKASEPFLAAASDYVTFLKAANRNSDAAEIEKEIEALEKELSARESHDK